MSGGIPVGVLAGRRRVGGPLTFLGSRGVSQAAGTFTFSGVPLGLAHPDRTILVSVTSRATQRAFIHASLTIGGVSATRDGIAPYAPWGYPAASIWRASVPEGVAADVVVTCVGNHNDCYICVYSTTSTLMPAHTAAGPASATLPTEPGGFYLACVAAGRLSSETVTSSNFEIIDLATPYHHGRGATTGADVELAATRSGGGPGEEIGLCAVAYTL